MPGPKPTIPTALRRPRHIKLPQRRRRLIRSMPRPAPGALGAPIDQAKLANPVAATTAPVTTPANAVIRPAPALPVAAAISPAIREAHRGSGKQPQQGKHGKVQQNANVSHGPLRGTQQISINRRAKSAVQELRTLDSSMRHANNMATGQSRETIDFTPQKPLRPPTPANLNNHPEPRARHHIADPSRVGPPQSSTARISAPTRREFRNPTHRARKKGRSRPFVRDTNPVVHDGVITPLRATHPRPVHGPSRCNGLSPQNLPRGQNWSIEQTFIYAKLRAQLRTHYARTERRQHVHPLFDNLTKPPPVAREPPRTIACFIYL